MSNLDTKERPTTDGGNPGAADYERKFGGNGDIEKGFNAPDGKYPTGHPSRVDEQAAESAKGLLDSGSGANGGAEAGFYNNAASGGGSSKKLLANFKANKKKYYFGIGGVTGIILTIFMLMIPVLGPLKIMHMAQLLHGIHFSDQEDVSAARIRNMHHYYKYIKTGTDGGLQNTRMGIIKTLKAGRIDKKLAKQGLSVNFDNGKFKGVDVDLKNLPDDLSDKLDGTKDDAARNKIIKEHLGIDKDTDIKITRNGSKVTVDIDDNALDKKAKRKLAQSLNNKLIRLSTSKTIPGITKANVALKTRILNVRANTGWNPATRLSNDKKMSYIEKIRDFRAKLQGGKTGKVSAGVKTTKTNTEEPDLGNPDSNKPDTPDSDSQQTRDAVKKAGDADKPSSLRNSLTNAKGGLILGVVVATCAVRDISGDVANQQLDQKIGSFRDSYETYKSSQSKIKSGGDAVDYGALGVINESLDGKAPPDGYDAHYNANPHEIDNPKYSSLGGSAYGSSALLKETTGQTTKRTFDNEEVAVANPDDESSYKTIASFFSNLGIIDSGLGVVCGAVNLFGEAFSWTISKVTFGWSEKLEDATMGKATTFLFSKMVGEEINMFAVQWAGLAFGEGLSMGARSMANEAAAANGMSVTSDSQAADIAIYTADQKRQNDTRSTVAKFFDLQDADSVASKIAISTYSQEPTTALASMPSLLVANISNLFSPNAKAAPVTTRYDYYTMGKVGMHPAILNDERFANPFSNVLVAQDNLFEADTAYPDLKGYIEQCHGITINNDLSIVSKGPEEATNRYMETKLDDSECEDPQKGDGTWVAGNSRLAYTPENSPNNALDDIAALFGEKKAYAATAGTTTATLTPSQTAYYSAVHAINDTNIFVAYSCDVDYDEEACNDITHSQNTSSDNGGAVDGKKDGEIFNEDHMQPDAIKIGRTVIEKWPEVKTIGGWRPQDAYPDHPSGRALDIMMPDAGPDSCGASPGLGNEINDFLKKNAKKYNIQYTIWRQQYWSPGASNTMGDRGGCTANHMDHVHVTVNK